MRKICVVTGSRAEYGLLYWILREIEKLKTLQLQLVVSGAHLSPEFGLSHRIITMDGFHIDRRVEMVLSSDTATGVSKSMGLGLIGFSDAFEELKPDLIVLLGDRFELLAASSAAMVAVIPIAHIHGGEITEGAFDDAIRHSITKMSHLHFTSTEEYRNRVIQLGEDPSRVFNFGAPGIDSIRRTPLKDRVTIEQEVGLELGPRSLLVTWHPATLDPGGSESSFQNILKALDELEDTRIVFTKSNVDPEGRKINSLIDNYVQKNRQKCVVHTSLGTVAYLSLLREVDGVVGNSSSGIIEAPSLNTGTINIGGRQGGRVRAISVIDCDEDVPSIRNALIELFSSEFSGMLKELENPYDGGDASGRIVEVLSKFPLDDIHKKTFFDLYSDE